MLLSLLITLSAASLFQTAQLTLTPVKNKHILYDKLQFIHTMFSKQK